MSEISAPFPAAAAIALTALFSRYVRIMLHSIKAGFYNFSTRGITPARFDTQQEPRHMTVDPQKQDLKIGVVGAGAMGRGIAQVSATGGMPVYIYDAADGAAAAARDFIVSMIERSVEKGRMDAAEGAEAAARINVAENMVGLADCDVVVEAIVENLEIKQKVFRQLEEIVRRDAIIASNTSSIRISSIASACTHRDRIAGLHFFNPVPLMKLVEVINGTDTSDEVTQALEVVGKRMGRVPVVVKDAPGFLVNLGGRSYTTEALRIVSEGVAT